MIKNYKIHLSKPEAGGDEIDYLRSAIERNEIGPWGENLLKFEKELSTYLGVENVLALNSGTAAIHLALSVLGVSRGDYVICQSFTFAGSAFPILYQGAIPIFIDSEKQTWNMDPVILEEAIKKSLTKGIKPKAIIVVHIYGMPALMDEIMSISLKYNIPVIEDAAEAFGSEYKGRKAGTLGDLGVYSFNSNKIITTSGGGVLVSSQKEYISKARFLASQARESELHYQHKELGYNYLMSNICASIGLGQLVHLKNRIKFRRELNEQYKKALNKYNFDFQNEMDGFYSNCWLTAVRTDSFMRRENLLRIFQNEDIEVRPLWKPMHLQPVFDKHRYYGDDVCENLFEKGLCLPFVSNKNKLDIVLNIVN